MTSLFSRPADEGEVLSLSSLPERYYVEDPSLKSSVLTTARLPNIDPTSVSLHKALHRFRPLTSDYAITDYAQAFNWAELKLPKDEEREWYCVVFRSKRSPGSDGISLYDADKLAHDEAIQNGGLILYWYGVPHQETGMNMSTCIWQSRKLATESASHPCHAKAMGLAAEVYDVYSLERYVLRKKKGEEGVTLEAYMGGEVGW